MEKVNARIIVVDDQEAIRQLLVEICTLLGYEVKTAANGDEACQLVSQELFDIALVDLKMNGMNGIETMRRLREIRPDLKGIFMTGYVEAKLDHAVLKKPFDLQEIKTVLEEVLSK